MNGERTNYDSKRTTHTISKAASTQTTSCTCNLALSIVVLAFMWLGCVAQILSTWLVANPVLSEMSFRSQR